MNNRIAGYTALERLEPCAGKLACTVLRGAYNSNVVGLLDFSFVGTQIPIEIDGENYFIDVLFYHLKLRAFVVVELKAKKFKPADLGQLSFYLAAVDEIFRHPQDNPTIGILLCESRSKIIAEYALKKINAPIGVSEYTLSKALPKELKLSLPSIEELEAELNEVIKQDGIEDPEV